MAPGRNEEVKGFNEINYEHRSHSLGGLVNLHGRVPLLPPDCQLQLANRLRHLEHPLSHLHHICSQPPQILVLHVAAIQQGLDLYSTP